MSNSFVKSDTGEMTPEETSSATKAHTEKTDGIVYSPEDLTDEYDLPGDQKGLFILFNHFRFENDPENRKQRTGTNMDVTAITKTLADMKFHVDMDNVHNDFTTEQIKQKLNEAAQMDLKDRHSLIVMVLTHGNDEGCLQTRDGKIKCEEIWTIFQNCKDLAGKPKIFIFQACKGKGVSMTIDLQISSDSYSEKAALGKFSLPVEADFLISFSTFEGNKAFRSGDGSWFIQDLCKVIKNYGCQEDFISILTIVAKHVGYGREGKYVDDDFNIYNAKQIPTFLSTLTKKYYLCCKEDRLMNKNFLMPNSQEKPFNVHIENSRNCTVNFHTK